MATIERLPAATVETAGRVRRTLPQRLREWAMTTWVYALTTLGAFVFLLPFFWMLSTSLKSRELTYKLPITWVPETLRWQNYTDAWFGTSVDFNRLTLNTLIITVGATLGTLVSGSLVAYGFARLRFPGRDALFVLVLSTLMLPFQVTMIPTFILYKNLGWLQPGWVNFLPLIVPAWLGGGAFNIFLFRQFFRTIPLDLEEAARIDGCGYSGTFLRIIVPLSTPAFAAVAIFNFVWHWNDFLGPLLYLRDDKMKTLSLGLQIFQRAVANMGGNAGSLFDVQLVMAAAMVVLLPIIAVFFFAQHYFIQGITLTGMKG